MRPNKKVQSQPVICNLGATKRACKHQDQCLHSHHGRYYYFCFCGHYLQVTFCLQEGNVSHVI